MSREQQQPSQNRSCQILAVGFGTAVTMWIVGYLARLPGLELPPAVVGTVLLILLALGGAVAGRFGTLGWRGGGWAGALTSLLNLLVLGSLLAQDKPNQLHPAAVFWLPGSLLAGAGIGATGAALGAQLRRNSAREPHWTGAFAAVAATATLALLAIGGTVTSHAAGLAVVDWPNSFGYNMFLYPLSRMTGGVYYEHAHRLFGSLVGLTTVVLAICLWRGERRSIVRWLSFAAVFVVTAQGVLGGLRVTGGFTLSTDPAAMAPSTRLALLHGVLGQLFFATMMALAVLTSRAWQQPTLAASPAVTDRILATSLPAAVAVQLVLGALQRHLGKGLVVHITIAAIVAVLAVAVGSRLWGLYPQSRVLAGWGKTILVTVGVQLLLGLAALVAVGEGEAALVRTGWRALVTTLHQTMGAVVLGAAVAAALFVGRMSSKRADASANQLA